MGPSVASISLHHQPRVGAALAAQARFGVAQPSVGAKSFWLRKAPPCAAGKSLVERGRRKRTADENRWPKRHLVS